MIAGRPLRFLAVVTGGWATARAVMLWPGAPPLAIAGRAIVPHVAAAQTSVPTAPVVPSPTAWIAALDAGRPAAGSPLQPLAKQRLPAPAAATPSLAAPPWTTGIVAGLPMPLPTPSNDTPARDRSRLFGSAWLFVRGGGPAAGIDGPQLGGSQAGLRLAYALTRDRRLALVARFSTPLGKGSRDLGLGLEWQPTRLPVRVIAEQRIAVDGGRGGPILGLVGGAGPLPIAAGFDLEAYAQAGIIGRGKGEGYADGAARLARPVTTLGKVRIDFGAGAWGAAQKGAARLDIGPSLTAHVPLGHQAVRVSIDWRQRIAGNATPGSGLVLSLGADF